MNLSNNIISQFVKMTNDSSRNKDQTKTYGTIVKSGDIMYVQLDGSDLMTPIDTTVHVDEGDRVTVTVKNHNVTVDGNLSDISASNGIVEGIEEDVATVTENVSTVTENVATVTENVATVTENVATVTENVNTIEARTGILETLLRGLENDTDGNITNVNAAIEQLSNRTTTLEEKVDTIETAIADINVGFDTLYNGIVVTDVCGTATISIGNNDTTDYLVVVNIKAYNFGDNWENIVTQKACVYVSDKAETSFTITTDIIGLNISDGSQITTGTAEIQYSLIL